MTQVPGARPGPRSGPPSVPPTRPQPEPLPARLDYHQVYRAGRQGWWWSVSGIVVLIVATFVVAPLVVVMAFLAYFLATDSTNVYDRTMALADTGDVTPGVLLFLNLCLIAAIPISWFCIRVFHGLKPRWLASVAPRIRWRWLAVSFVIAFVSLVLAIVLGALLPSTAGETEMSGVNTFTRTTRDFVIVVVLFTPLQAVAEEYAFRGYLTQAFGGLVNSRAVAVLGPALLFALAHGIGQSVPIFFDRFAFGVVSGILVILTGGLEAGIAMHVLNNVLAYGIALTFGDMTSALNPTGGSWWNIVVTLVKSLVFLGLSLWAAKKLGLQTRTGEGVLERPRPRV